MYTINISLLVSGCCCFIFAAAGLHSVAVMKVKCVVFEFYEEKTMTSGDYFYVVLASELQWPSHLSLDSSSNSFMVHLRCEQSP